METQVFKSRSDFLNRPNKEINGVSADFANSHPNYEQDNVTNKGCWNCHNCRNCKDSRNCNNCSNLINSRNCHHCIDCYNCNNCSNSDYCFNLNNCSNSCNLFNFNDEVEDLQIPIIENIHAKVFEATNNGGLLDMNSWHSSCGTTHCRAGWVVALAGEKGSKLEAETSTPFAASAIYSKSSRIEVDPSLFYAFNEASMKDIALCAKLEREGKSGRDT